MEGQTFTGLLRNFLPVLAVARWQQHGADAGPLGREYLLLDAAHWQHQTPQGDLPGHGDVLTDAATT